MRTDYRFGFFDAQIILVTNFHLLKSRGRLSKPELTTKFFQTIVKCIRDYCNCDKVILLWDKGPYHRSEIVEDHKADRFYVTEDVINQYKQIEPISTAERERYVIELIAENKDLTKEELDNLISEYRASHPTVEEYEKQLETLRKEFEANKIKQETKYWIIENFGQIGMPSLLYDGYEADDLAKICMDIVFKDKSDNRRSYLCSKDSDWRYLLNPNSDILKYHRGDMESYDDVVKEVPEDLLRRGVGLYLWKALQDSLHGSHNNFQNCLKNSEFDYIDFISHIDDVEWLEQYCDTDVFLPQYISFNITKFDDYNRVRDDIRDKIFSKNEGSLMSTRLFSNFTAQNHLNISSNYYDNFKSLINEEEYNSTNEDVNIDELLASL